MKLSMIRPRTAISNIAASLARAFFERISPLRAYNACKIPTAKALEDPSPELDGMSEKVEISIGSSMFNNRNASRTIG